jgi:hypothetical protein
MPLRNLTQQLDSLSIPLGGRLAHFKANWLSIQNVWIRSIVLNGLKWSGCELIKHFPMLSQKSNHILDAHIQKMLDMNVIERVVYPINHWISRVFTVPKPGGTRFIIDLKKLNTLIPCPTFRMTSHHSVRQLLPVGSWTTSIDLEAAYFHIPIHPGWRRFLAFTLDRVTYRFKSMPFGLNIAPRVFTKILKEILSILRLDGVQIIAYLDDLLIWAPSEESCRQDTQRVQITLKSFGFLINLEKSRLSPNQHFAFLGVAWSLTDHTWGITQEKQSQILTRLKQFRKNNQASKREWERLLGLLNFVAPLLPQGRLHLHDLILEVNFFFRRKSRDLLLPTPSRLIRLLNWWTPSRLRMTQSLLSPPISRQILTDASGSGWGAISQGDTRKGLWDPSFQDVHSNAKELMAVVQALLRFPLDPDTSILILSDNKSTVACLNKQGSARSTGLQKISHRVFQLASRRRLHLIGRYIPGALNTGADALSRNSPIQGEWTLDWNSFYLLCKILGVPEVDLFASRENSKLPLFISPYPDQTAVATDALATDWNRWNFIYLFPPVGLLPKVLQKLRLFKGKAAVVAPFWPQAAWFPSLSLLLPGQLKLPNPTLSQMVQGSSLTNSSKIYSHLTVFHS